MPRSARLILPKSFYHIMARGNNKNIIFKSDEDYNYYLSLIAKYKAEHPFDLYHYCLMPNHIHFLIKTDKGADFSTFMKKINLAYFYHYKQTYGWVGHFWQDRFKSQPVGKDNYFIQCGKYVELNPFRKRLLEKPEDYQYSSYNYYAFGKKDDLVSRDLFYDDLGKTDKSRRENYRELIIEQIVADSISRLIWGSPRQIHNELTKINYHNKSLKVFKS
jgi:putative transposase